MSELTTLAQEAASRFGLLTIEDLLATGLSKRAVGQHVQRGALHRVRHGLYIRSPAPPTWHHTLAAAYVHVRGLGAVSHRSAARLLGLRNDADLDLTVVYPANAGGKGISIHRSRDLDSRDIDIVDGFATTTPVRTLCDLGLVLPPREVERTIDHAIAVDIVDVDSLRQLREELGKHGRTGVGAVDIALADMPPEAPLTESGPELRLLKLLSKSPLPTPIPQFAIRAGGKEYRADLAYPDYRIVIEFDGEDHHSTPEQLAADAVRQRHLEAVGWVVIRFRWEDICDGSEFESLGRIRVALWSRGWRLGDL